MVNVDNMELARLLDEQLSSREARNLEFMIVFKHDNRFEMFTFGEYGFKVNTEERIHELFAGKSFGRVNALIEGARKYFQENGKMRVKAYSDLDPYASSSREELIILFTNNFRIG